MCANTNTNLATPNTRFLQLNCMKSPAVIHALADVTDSRVMAGINTIVGIQEPQYIEESRSIPRFTSSNLIYDRSGPEFPVRAALYSNNILQPFPQYIGPDISTARWVLAPGSRFSEIVVTSVYMPTYEHKKQPSDPLVPYKPVWPPLFEKLLRHCERNNTPIIVLSDTNCHSTLWGHPESNPRGKMLEQLLLNYSLEVHNQGKLPEVWTWNKADKFSIIDLSITSTDISDFVQNWKITNNVPFGDHRCLEFDVNMASIPCTYFRNLKKGNWPRFQTIIRNISFDETKQYTKASLEKEASKFTKVITEALDKTHPLQKRVYVTHKPKWYDDETDKAKKAVKKAHDKWRRRKSLIMHMLLQDARRSYRRLLFKKKKRSWKHFVNNHTSFKDVAAFKKILNKQQMNQLGTLQKGTKKLNAKESLNLLAEEHFPGCISVPKETTHDPATPIPCDIDDDRVSFITNEKVLTAIKSFGDYKAPGPDGFKPLVLKQLPSNAVEHLTRLYKASILLAYTPTAWRESTVIFIPKQDKDDYADPRSYRPISLMSTLMKTLERVILWEMQATTLAQNPLHTNQHAFRKGRSTDSALTNMVEYIEAAFHKKHVAIGVFVDIKGAFDNVTTTSIISGLKKRGENPLIINWYEHFLKNRTINIEYKGNVTKRKLTRGTPQGGVLSPIMWNVAFDTLLHEFPDKPTINLVGFADDGSLLVTAKSPRTAWLKAQNALNKIYKWGQRHSLTFAASKTKAVLFSRQKTIINDLPSLKLNNDDIEYVSQTKYLGVTLDQKLTWQSHLKNKIDKGKKLLFKVRKAAGKLWGLNPKMSIWFYRAIVRPMISYGAMVWLRLLNSKKVRKKLESLQRLALMSMGHFRKSTPTAGLEVITYTCPLWLHIMQEGTMAYLRTLNLTKLPRNAFSERTRRSQLQNHRQCAQKFLDTIGYQHDNTDDIIPVHNWTRNFHLNTTSFEIGDPTDTNDDITVYTDGSQDASGNTGSGFVIFHQNIEQHTEAFHLGNQITVFQSEVHAIYKAVNHLHNAFTENRHITIHSDSRAALLAVNSNTIKSTLVKNTVLLLNALAENNIVEIQWVKAHVGHHGNETADALAKAGALDRTLQANDTPLSSNHSLRVKLRKCVQKYWDYLWHTESPCRQTKLFFPHLDKKLSNNLTKCRRAIFSGSVQFITGHNFLAYHECLVENDSVVDETALCSFCDSDIEETSYHILAECDAFAAARFSTWGKDILEPPFSNLTNQDIVAFLRETQIPAFLNLLDFELQ